MKVLPSFAALALAVVLAAVSAPVPSKAQAPSTIKVIVPFPAGGSADLLARVFGDQIGKAHGVTVLIENRPGGGPAGA
jgi:tripartite-type tricarboxylate transporter receptor subunit TctC